MAINIVNIKTLKEYDEDEDDSVSYAAISSEEGNLLVDDEMAYSKQKQMLQDNRPKPSSGLARKCFTPASVFSKTGISKQYAGEAILNQLVSACPKQLEEEREVQSAELEEVSKTAHKEKEAEKKREETVEPKPSFVYPDIPFFQCSALKKLREFRKRLQYIGPYKEALVARQDLKNRRQLCKVDKMSVFGLRFLHCINSTVIIKLLKAGSGATSSIPDPTVGYRPDLTQRAALQAWNQFERHKKAAAIKTEIICSSWFDDFH